MNIDAIPAGKNPPSDINVVIEITGGSNGGQPVKYELDKDSGAVFVDRIVNTPMFYPCNYGFVPNSLHDDGDPTVVQPLSSLIIDFGMVRAQTVPEEAGGRFVAGNNQHQCFVH